MDLIVLARTYRHVGDRGAAAEKGGRRKYVAHMNGAREQGQEILRKHFFLINLQRAELRQAVRM